MIPLHRTADAVRWSTSRLDKLRVAAFQVINRLQDMEPHEQVAGTYLAAVAMADAVGLDPHEEIERARRCMNHAEGPFTHQVQAVRDYARNELAGRVL